MPQEATDPERSIRERAYFLWQLAGEPAGKAEEFWAQAKKTAADPAPITLFAYGPNMCTAAMLARCPGAIAAGRAYIPDQQLCFPRWCNRRQSYIAGFRPAAGEILHGALWVIPAREIAALDAAEGFDPGRSAHSSYLREDVEIVRGDGSRGTAQAYVAVAGDEGAPSAEYLDLLVQGATERQLPPGYIDSLQRLSGNRSLISSIGRMLRRLNPFGWPQALTSSLLGAADDVRARAKSRAMGHAYRHYRRAARRWDAAAFIPESDQKTYRFAFCRKLLPIERGNLRIARLRHVVLALVFTLIAVYCAIQPVPVPAVLAFGPEDIALVVGALPLWLYDAIRFVARSLLGFFVFALWFDLFFLLAYSLTLIGISEAVVVFTAWTAGALASAAVWLGHHVAAFAADSAVYSVLYYAAALFLGCTAILGAAALVLAALLDALRRRSERLHPDANCVDLLFNALWSLQRAGANWTSLGTRSTAMRGIGHVSSIVRRVLLPRPMDDYPATLAWRSQQALKMSMALARKQRWLMTPKSDTREALFHALGPTIIVLLSGAWDNLELVEEPLEGTADAGLKWHPWRVAADLARTILIALLPTGLFFVASIAGILADVGASALGYVKIGLFVWASLTILFRLDPLLKEKLATLKEAAQMLRPGSKKE